MKTAAKELSFKDSPASPPADLPYKLPWRSLSLRPGAHRSGQEGAGGYFRDFATLLARPDPRRIDLRASARDPFDGLFVRRFEQKSAVTVYALLDVSASMGFRGNTDKMQLAAALVGALAASARRSGDTFGLIGCNDAIVPALHLPAGRSPVRELEMRERIGAFTPRGRGVNGLLDASQLLSGSRKLVLLLSDFHMPMSQAERIFAALSTHDILPIILHDTLELECLPRWGILSLTDLELGRRRLVLMRPALRDIWLRRNEARRAELFSVAARYGREPFEVRDRIDWDRLAAYLIGGGG